MGLTDAQRQRMEENRLKAQARLRERRLNGQGTPRPEEKGAGAKTSMTATGSAARAGFVSCRAGRSRVPDGGSEKSRGKDAERTGREAEGAERSSSTTSNCEGCGRAAEDIRLDQELLDGFGISVCRDCKLSREEFQCIPKREAKDTYLLPEGTIMVLKFIERDNPHHSSWNKMKLFLRREVMEYSLKRWGSESALEAERARRETLKYDRSLSRTKGVFKRAKLDREGYRYVGGDPDDED